MRTPMTGLILYVPPGPPAVYIYVIHALKYCLYPHPPSLPSDEAGGKVISATGLRAHAKVGAVARHQRAGRRPLALLAVEARIRAQRRDGWRAGPVDGPPGVQRRRHGPV